MRFILVLIIPVLISCNLLGSEAETSNIEVFENIWNEYNLQYSLFDVKKVDWDDVYRDYKAQISDEMGDYEFFLKMGEMLTILNDSHVSIVSQYGYISSRPVAESLFDFEIVKSYLENATAIGNDNLVYGNIGDKGYLYIKTFNYESVEASTLLDWAEYIDDAVEFFEDYDSVIIDIRANNGGLPQTGYYIANRFADKKRAFQTVQNKNGPGRDDFSDPVTYYVEPDGPKQYCGTVYLLTDEAAISAAEDFVMAMKALPNVIQVGKTTGGIFSLSLARDLPNGWRCKISVQKIEDMNGICYEGIGMAPDSDYIVNYEVSDKASGIDTQLEFTLNL